MLTLRQKKLLSCLVKEFVEEKKPVASKRLKENFDLDLSSATIRNEFHELEKAGYLAQPHTSAGRVPSDKAYRFYVDNLMQLRDLSRREKQKIEKSIRKRDKLKREAELARALSSFGDNLALCDLRGDEIFFWGMRQLFSKPEFDKDHILETSEFLERLRTDYEELLDLPDSKRPQAYIGSDSELTDKTDTALIVVSLDSKDNCFLGIFGPKRMDYAHNIALLGYVAKLLES